MVFRSRNWLSFAWIILLWRLGRIRAYVEVCEFTPINAYCSCEELSRDLTSYRVTCTVFRDVEQSDPIWRSIGDSDTISYLKLQPRLPIVLNYIPSDDLRRMPNLRILTMESAILGTLKSYAVSGYKNLEELYLEGNGIQALERNAISSLPKLKKLTLAVNSLQEILEGSFSDLLGLEILYLERNNISRIEPCAFCNLQNLKELDLWGNQISDLTEYAFRGLRYLRKLDLYKNKIRILNDKIFHNMPRLMEIELKENMISHIAPGAFIGMDKLEILSLSNNLIKFLPSEVFSPLPNLRSVDLFQNRLENLQGEVVDNMKNSNVRYFAFSFTGNPYRCDCDMEWVSRYLKVAKSPHFERELKTVECKSENETMKVLEYLNTTDCKKSVIKPRVSSALITSLITKSTDSVPVELQSQKSKPVATAAASPSEGTEEAYLSDVVNDKPDTDGSGDGSQVFRADVCFVMLVSLLSLIVFENRREV